jgi:hypothetical protein
LRKKIGVERHCYCFLLFAEKIVAGGGGGGVWAFFVVFFEGGLGKSGRMLMVFCGEVVVFWW